MQRGGRCIDCHVWASGPLQWECALFDEDWCVYRRQWKVRLDAIRDAESQREQLARAGWSMA